MKSLLDGSETVDSGQTPVQGLTAEAYERRIQRLESDKTELTRKLMGKNNVTSDGLFVRSNSDRKKLFHGLFSCCRVDSRTAECGAW